MLQIILGCLEFSNGLSDIYILPLDNVLSLDFLFPSNHLSLAFIPLDKLKPKILITIHFYY